MYVEKNKAVVRQIFETDYSKVTEQIITKQKAELFSSDFVSHTPEGDLDLDTFFKGVSAMLKAFPDVKFTLEDMVAEGDKVTTRYTVSGTHKGEFMGIPATGKKFKISGFEIRRLSGGKMVEYWGLMDSLSLMRQLGAMPPARQR